MTPVSNERVSEVEIEFIIAKAKGLNNGERQMLRRAVLRSQSPEPSSSEPVVMAWLDPQGEVYTAAIGPRAHTMFPLVLLSDYQALKVERDESARKWRAYGDTMHRRAMAAEEALKPFAEAAADIDGSSHPDWEMWEHPASMNVSVRDFLRAREALTTITGGENER